MLYRIVEIRMIKIKMHDRVMKTSKDNWHVSELKKNIIPLGLLHFNG